MKKGTKTGLIILVVLAVLGMMVFSSFSRTYNAMITLDEGVKEKWKSGGKCLSETDGSHSQSGGNRKRLCLS